MFNFFKRSTTTENQPQDPLSVENSTGSQPHGANSDQTVSDEPLVGFASAPETKPLLAQVSPEKPVVNDPPLLPNPKLTPEPPKVSAPAAKPLYPPLPSQKPRKSLAYSLFSPETRLGRFMRPFIRGLAVITGFFALGLLAGYILIYQPTQRELDAALQRNKLSSQSISQKDQTLQVAQSNSDQAQLSLKQVQTQLNKSTSENGLLVVLVGISSARVSLVNKDGPAAKAALEQAQTDLATILPYIYGIDQNKADLLKSRLDLAAKELVSDPSAAQTDLDKLFTDLADLHKKLFK